MRPLNIVMSLNCFMNLTGSELYHYEIGSELVRRGHKVTIMTNYGGELADRAKANSIEFKTFNEFLPKQPDIVHSSQAIPTQLMIAKFPNIPVVQTVHSEFPTCETPYISPNIFKYIYIREEIGKVLTRDYPIDPKITEFLPNGFDTSRFNLEGSSTPSKPIVLFIGTFDKRRWQAIMHLIDRVKRKEIELWLMGKNFGMNTDYLQNYVKLIEAEWETEKYIKACSETAGIMLGRTTIEGWLCGKPGWIYDVEDNGTIKSIQLYQPPQDLEKYNIKNIVTRLEDIYQEVLTGLGRL